MDRQSQPGLVTGTATYTGRYGRRCQYCGQPAQIFDVDGSWCSDEHQRYDRQSEISYWRRAVQR